MKVEIEIRTYPKLNPLRTAAIPAMQVGVIGIGVAANSDAMQWAGFVMFWIFLLVITAVAAKRDSGLTIKEARRQLDEIEKQERAR